MSAPSIALQQAAIRDYAKQLRLPTLGTQFVALAEQAIKAKQSHISYLEALLAAELEEREHNTVARRLQEARLPKLKTLEEFEFQKVPQIPAALIRHLAEGDYLKRSEPVVLLGETGTRQDPPRHGIGGSRLSPTQTRSFHHRRAVSQRTHRGQA